MKPLLLSVIMFFCSVQLYAKTTLTFAVVPQQSASKLAKLWGPIIADISEQTGLSINFATAPDIPTFEQRLAKGEYDIAYMNPYHFVVFNKNPGYQAVAKARDKRIKGIIVVAKNGQINNFQQLNNTTLAFPAPAAFAATILTQSDLKKKHVSFTPKYVSSHDSVYRTVAKGIYPAGGGVLRTFNNMEEAVREQLTILHTTQGYTPHAIAIHPDIDQKTVAKLQAALVSLEQTEQGKVLLKNIKIKGFEQAKNQDWDDVRALQLAVKVEQ